MQQAKSNAKKLDSQTRAAFLSQDGIPRPDYAFLSHLDGGLSPETSQRATQRSSRRQQAKSQGRSAMKQIKTPHTQLDSQIETTRVTDSLQTGNARIKWMEVASPRSMTTAEQQRALTDYTGTLTEDAVADDGKKVCIVDDAQQPKPILKSNNDMSDTEQTTTKPATLNDQTRTIDFAQTHRSFGDFQEGEILMQKRVISANKHKRRIIQVHPQSTKNRLSQRPFTGINDIRDDHIRLNNQILTPNLGSTRYNPQNKDLSKLSGPPTPAARSISQALQSQGLRQNEEINISNVTPQLAAQVVKHFVLPMFDTEAKKGLRRKYGRMQASEGYTSMQHQVQDQTLGSTEQDGTVLGDLKLTEHLSNQLEQLKQRFDQLTEELEMATLERDQCKKLNQRLIGKSRVQDKEIQLLRKQLKHQRKVNMGLESKLEQQQYQETALIRITLVSEEMRKLFSEQLRECLAQDEANKNTIFNQQVSSQIQSHSISFLQEQFKILFEAIHNISADKRLGDQLKFEISEITHAYKNQVIQVKELLQTQSNIIKERDAFKEDTNELIQGKKKVEFDLRMQTQSSKQKIDKLERDYKTKSEECEKVSEDLMKSDRQNKKLLDEGSKMRARIAKLIAKKGKFDSSTKTCKNCGKEYSEKENFHWSCTQHIGEWGGQMWWCCGKQNKEDRGCKFSKHESKDDDDDDLNDENAASKNRAQKYAKCYCCGEQGHSIAECPRDPNFVTGLDPDKEIQRLQRIRDFRKMNADTAITTTHFLKKSIMVPLQEDDEGVVKETTNNIYHPFMRGAMEFDDYNYKLFNSYILLQEPSDPNEKRRMAKVDQMKNQIQGGDTEKLDEKTISKYSEGDYVHDLTHIEPSEKQKAQAEAKLKQEQEEAEMKRKVESQKSERKKSVIERTETIVTEDGVDPATASVEDAEEVQAVQEEKEEYQASDDEDYLFRVYYKDEEIKAALEQQDQDHFEMLMYDKQEAIEEAQQYVGLQNKFNITDFTPMDKTKIEKPPTKFKRRNTRVLFGEEQDLDDSDDSEQFKMRKKGKLTQKEQDQQMHVIQQKAIENDILAMIEERLENSPRFSQNSSKNSQKSKSALKKKRGKGQPSPSPRKTNK